jgi:hypothetical protein
VRVATTGGGKMLTYRFTNNGDNLCLGTGQGRGWGDLSTYGYDAGAGDSTGGGDGADGGIGGCAGEGSGEGEGGGAGYGDGEGGYSGRWEDATL